jgi:hypothetical protein
MDLGRVLTHSWEIIWKHKVLWVFGILAALGGQASGLGSRFNYSFEAPDTGNLPGQFDRFFADWEQGWQQFINDVGVPLLIGFACLAVILAIIFWVVGVYGKIGVIQGVLSAEARRPVSFGAIAKANRLILGPAVGLNLILVLMPIAVIILFVIFAIVLAIITLGIGLLCLLPLVCLIIPIAIAYNVYVEMANIILVSEGKGIRATLTSAWLFFRSQLGPLALMALVLIVGGLIVGVILAAPFLGILAPAFIALIGNDPQAVGPAITTTIVLIVIAIPIYLVVGGIITSYVQSAWTLTYKQLSPAAKPRIKARAL